MGFPMGGSMFGAFGIFGILFFIVFASIMGVIIFMVIRGLKQWNKNNHSPRLTVPATIVGKRADVSYHHGAGEMHHHHSHTTYYVTFQVASGDRMELSVPGTEYGILIEGDRGEVSFQGTRYLGFRRG